jgi:type II secretory pathway pseudopilin PulG
MLVVVAVIGILSSVLLTGLGPAREKAKDSRIVTEVNQVRAIAAALDNGGYSALPSAGCGEPPLDSTSYPELSALERDIAAQGGQLVVVKSRPPDDNLSRAYVVYSRLNVPVGNPPNQLTNYFCADSKGRSGFSVDLDLCAYTDPNDVVCPVAL